MKFWILEYLYQIKCESRLLYGAEVCEEEKDGRHLVEGSMGDTVGMF